MPEGYPPVTASLMSILTMRIDYERPDMRMKRLKMKKNNLNPDMDLMDGTMDQADAGVRIPGYWNDREDEEIFKPFPGWDGPEEKPDGKNGRKPEQRPNTQTQQEDPQTQETATDQETTAEQENGTKNGSDQKNTKTGKVKLSNRR